MGQEDVVAIAVYGQDTLRVVVHFDIVSTCIFCYFFRSYFLVSSSLFSLLGAVIVLALFSLAGMISDIYLALSFACLSDSLGKVAASGCCASMLMYL
jgi:hypothetical protein